jgi:site-specific recombinase XerD
VKHLPIYNEAFEQYLDEFNTALSTQGYKGTGMYYSIIREFLFFSESKGIIEIKDIQAAEIIAYYEYLRERPNQRKEGGLSETMIRHHLFGLRLFFDYLLEAGEIESSPARLPKFNIGKPNERNILSIEEVQELHASCETKRDKALIGIAYGCGLRRSEIEKLNMADVMLSKGMVIVREGKGGKYRSVPVSDSVLKDLKEYVLYERHKYLLNGLHSEAFFISNQGRRITGQYHADRLKEIILRTLNPVIISKGITLHCLRHSIATHLLDNGASIEFVQKFLGHAEMDTALIYSKKRKQRLMIMNQAEKYGKNVRAVSYAA